MNDSRYIQLARQRAILKNLIKPVKVSLKDAKQNFRTMRIQANDANLAWQNTLLQVKIDRKHAGDLVRQAERAVAKEQARQARLVNQLFHEELRTVEASINNSLSNSTVNRAAMNHAERVLDPQWLERVKEEVASDGNLFELKDKLNTARFQYTRLRHRTERENLAPNRPHHKARQDILKLEAVLRRAEKDDADLDRQMYLLTQEKKTPLLPTTVPENNLDLVQRTYLTDMAQLYDRVRATLQA